MEILGPAEKQEQFSHYSTAMKDEASLPGREEIRRIEQARILRGLLRIRSALAIITTLFLIPIIIYDPADWRVWGLVSLVVVLVLVSALDLLRLRQSRAEPLQPGVFDLGVILVLQSGLIWITGAMESPLVIILLPLGLFTGVALGPTASRLWLLLGISASIWLMALAGLYGWMPRTVPQFLDLGEGFYRRPVYLLTKTFILNVAIVLLSQAGLVIYRAISRMLDRAINARQQALELMAGRNRELSHLSGAIAHELKNPLASIQGLVQLLQRGGAADRQGARVEVLAKEIERMRGTLDEFLNFSRPLGELTIEQIDPAMLMADLTHLHEGIAHSRSIQITAPRGAPHPFWGDRRKLQQALINLLQNALEATPRGGEVTWIAEGDESHAVLGVRDTGPGMAPEILSRATSMGVTTKPSGSGIGLAVARAIAEQHGGALVAENLADKGCRVVLQIPREPRIESEK